jgi:mannose-6-phosphate isomerase-like protein (cupin superfamily)
MSQPVRATLEAARVAPIPPGSRSALLMQHGSMKLRYYAPRGADAQTPHDQDELYVIASGRGTFLVGSHRVPFGPGDVLLFDHLLLHRTASGPEMTRDRHAMETWLFAPSTYPEGQIPLVY